MDLLTLASRHRDWLALRQTTVATNIANANTPGFDALQVQPFAEVMRGAGTPPPIAVSHAGHLSPADAARSGTIGRKEETSLVTHSGNSVSIEDEMMTAGAIKRDYSLNVSVARTFRRMIMATMRG